MTYSESAFTNNNNTQNLTKIEFVCSYLCDFLLDHRQIFTIINIFESTLWTYGQKFKKSKKRFCDVITSVLYYILYSLHWWSELKWTDSLWPHLFKVVKLQNIVSNITTLLIFITPQYSIRQITGTKDFSLKCG